jgi:hypothetical protein
LGLSAAIRPTARCEYGLAAGEDQFRDHDWFWFNALPALAGLRLKRPHGFPLDNFCGLAEAADDLSLITEATAVRHINQLYNSC